MMIAAMATPVAIAMRGARLADGSPVSHAVGEPRDGHRSVDSSVIALGSRHRRIATTPAGSGTVAGCATGVTLRRRSLRRPFTEPALHRRELAPHLSEVGEALLRLLPDRPLHDGPRARAGVLGSSSRGATASPSGAARGSAADSPRERRAPAEQLVGHRADREDVRAVDRPDRAPAPGHVAGRPHHHPGPRGIAVRGGRRRSGAIPKSRIFTWPDGQAGRCSPGLISRCTTPF